MHYQQVWRIYDESARTHPTFVTQRVHDAILAVRSAPTRIPAGASILRMNMAALYGWGQVDFGRLCGHARCLRFKPTVTLPMAERVIESLRHAVANPRVNTCVPKARNRGVKPVEAYCQDLLWDPTWDGVGGLLRPPTFEEAYEEWRWLVEVACVSERQAALQVGQKIDSLRARYRRALAAEAQDVGDVENEMEEAS